MHWTEIDWRPHVRDEQIGGRRLRFCDYGEGPALVFVHGLGGSWQSWLENLPELGRRHRVIAVDLPGFGGSERLPAEPEISDYADTLAALLDRRGIDRCFLGGHSLGGLICSRFALDHPEKLDGLILINAGGVALGPVRLAVIVRSFLGFNAVLGRPEVTRAIALRPRLRHLFLAGFIGDWHNLSVEMASETIPRMAAPGFADAVRAGARAAADTGTEAITAPTLLLWGRRDRILPLIGAEKLFEVLSDARLEVIDDAGHCPMFETPAKFNAAIEAFSLEQELAAKPA